MSQTTTINGGNPIHGINAARVIRELVKKGKTPVTLRENPNIRFTTEELARISQFPKPENAVTNSFVNEVVKQIINGNKFLVGLFRLAQLSTQGLTGTIHGKKPAVIDLESLGMYYHGTQNEIEAKVIKYNKHTYIKPEDLKNGMGNMPLSFRWGVTRNEDGSLYCRHGKS